MKTSKDFEVYQLFCEYQRQQPMHANTYYQLGIITQKWMRDYDPFLQSAIVEENMKNAQLFLSLCQKYCDEKEARKNGKLYQGAKLAEVEGDPSFEAIQQDINDRLAEVKNFSKYYSEDLLCLVKCVTKYNLCIKIFKDINLQNSRLKDLYFLANDTLLSNIDALKTNFDSVLYYFRRLKTSLSEFPLGNFNPDYSLEPVQVYRLHGLTSSNFLNNKVVLWNFGEWVSSFRKILNTDVADLNKRLYETDVQHGKFIDSLKRMNNKGIPVNYKVNPGLLNKMYKYDYKSGAARLLAYQETKINFLEHYASTPLVITDSLHLRTVSTNPDFYFQLVAYKHNTDSLLRLLRQDATEEAVNKYNNFFTQRYNGFEGFQNYIVHQKIDNDSVLRSAFDLYNTKILDELKNDTISKAITYKNAALRFSLASPDSVKKEGYYTFCKVPAGNNKYLVSGSYVAKANDVSAFVALIDSANNLKWLKTFKPGAAQYYGLQLQPLNEGILLAMVAKTKKSQSVSLLLLDNEGNLKTSKEIKTQSLPRKILYDDINQTILVVVKGSNFSPFSEDADSLGMYQMDASLKVLWTKRFWFEGYLSNVLKVNNQFYVFGSYNKLKTPDGKNLALEEKKFNAFLSVVDADGKYVQTSTYPSNSSYYLTKVVKINSDYIDAIAVQDLNPVEILKSKDKKPSSYYFITTSKGEVYFSF
jgi:hypothetical protein